MDISSNPIESWCQSAGMFLLLVYLGIPTAVKLCPSILAQLVLSNRARFPLFKNLSEPESYGLRGTVHFFIETDDVRLGSWHILPESLHDSQLPHTQLLASQHPIMLYLHGNACTRGTYHRVELYKRMSAAGFHVIAVDYRGFGDSTGWPCEGALAEDALSAYSWVHAHSEGAPVYVWGHSLGTSVATRLCKTLSLRNSLKDRSSQVETRYASSEDHVAPFSALILEAPFNNMTDAVFHHPFSLPYRFLPLFTWFFIDPLTDMDLKFDTDKYIQDVDTPILILHATDDAVVPIVLGQKLYETARESGRDVTLHSFDADLGYGHKHIHSHPGLMDLVKQKLAIPEASSVRY